MLTRADFWQFVRRFKLAPPNETIVLGVSTGVDSMVLLDLIRHAPVEWQRAMQVVYIDHQLRSQSREETDFIQTYCHQRNIPLTVATWHHGQLTSGVEEAARIFRYQTFDAVVQSARPATLWLAHHNDDAVETMTMKLARSGAFFEQPGLQVQTIRHQNTQAAFSLVRPLLPYTKSDIREYANRHHVPHYEDATNQDERFLRNRVRQQIVPAFRDMNAATAAHVLRYTEELAAAQSLVEDRLSELTEQVVIRHQPDQWTMDRTQWRALPRGQQSLLLQYVSQPSGQTLTGRQITQCLDLINSSRASGEVQITQQWQLRISYHTILFGQNQTKVWGKKLPVGLSCNSIVFFPTGESWQLRKMGPGVAIAVPRSAPAVVLRQRQPGDEIQLTNGQHQSLRRFLINRKVPQTERDQLVLAAVGQAVWYIPNLYTRQLSEHEQPDTIKVMLQYTK
ncbi:MAG: tRNA lysidine(34) synthetase TilS [Schleiferilactobacillus harbinensis]|jgi:tRNA(Ile)-lysidine synthase|nr:tRNA lysidine(34) synthetase TilS [Schleiferilactobacillus harbinensis]MCI1913553.1 tRNA lysidine(34) synthetase TilS [Schleiferilactobacillus harbinensis]